ncbi:hypothetical protein Mal52_49830 [Symmachiella dynata]|uniref:Uncharacterized protein n=2 Tax=Symmachiella dynata TaxID=2527995 RepID=A0A517ZVF0_9PLAN|nr:hypothetical protein Mal52_49830 [Symmachiella dynata]
MLSQNWQPGSIVPVIWGVSIRVISTVRLSDILRMINYELSQLQDNPEWLDVLRAYSESTPDEQGRLTRVHDIEGIAEEHLPRIHGKLIAFGFLDFELADRHEGVFYQLTSLGRQGLIRLRDTGADTVDETTADEIVAENDAESDEAEAEATTTLLEEPVTTDESARESEAA